MAAAEYCLAPATLGRLVDWATDTLAETSESPRLDAQVLLAAATGVDRSTIFAFPERAVGSEVRDAFEQLVERRRDHVPVAYLTGRREFYGLTLEVGPGVLVPRPETELIIDTVLSFIGEDASANVLDLGTGSGAIALAIKHARPQIEVTAVDASTDALAVARRNGQTLGLDIRFIESSWFSAVAGERFDIVVANPPYVSSNDPALCGALRHEPAQALDGGRDGLDAIRVIVASAGAHINSGGWLFVEHGEDQGKATRNLAEQNEYRDVHTLQDLAGHDRVLAARAP